MCNFYCQKICGSDSFNIEEYNRISEELDKTDKTDTEKLLILHPPKCQEQCNSCKSIVKTRNRRTALTLGRRRF